MQAATTLPWLTAFVWVISANGADPFHPTIPKTWDDVEMRRIEIPLSHPEFSPQHVPASFYYRMPVREIFESYPVYHPDREPPGYLEFLRRQEPRRVWDSSGLRTKEDWIRAGKLVFEAPIGYGGIAVGPSHNETLYVRKRSWYQKVRPPLSSDGVVPFVRYVIRQKGKVELGVLACAMCHTRVFPNGVILEGGPGNFPFDAAFAEGIETEQSSLPENRKLLEMLYWKPWNASRFPAELETLNAQKTAALFGGRPPGVMTRGRLSLTAPLEIPDLIGVEHRVYLDHTGLQLHRGIADLMRYAALNQGGDDLASFGGFTPLAHFLGIPKLTADLGDRYSDEQLYALALYLYSLRPPPNQNRSNEQTLRGKGVFVREGCANCHPAPLYTNNKLTPAVNFQIPDGQRRLYNILPISVRTDPEATMDTRRGTGYYKVPSLLGLWYRQPLGHSGWVSTLEEWFDPKRLNDAYVPTGFIPSHRTHGAVIGHEFGLMISAEDKADLIAFLKTL